MAKIWMGALLFLAFATGASAEIVKIPEGTEVDLQFIEKLSSATAVEGQRFNLEVDQMARYAARLEQHCRAAPFNWFNFYDFWGAPPGSPPDQDRAQHEPPARRDAGH